MNLKNGEKNGKKKNYLRLIGSYCPGPGTLLSSGFKSGRSPVPIFHDGVFGWIKFMFVSGAY